MNPSGILQAILALALFGFVILIATRVVGKTAGIAGGKLGAAS